jgi:hypothetical protein
LKGWNIELAKHSLQACTLSVQSQGFHVGFPLHQVFFTTHTFLLRTFPFKDTTTLFELITLPLNLQILLLREKPEK